MGVYESANLYAMLVAFDSPTWEEQVAYTGAPTSGTAGVYLNHALRAAITVDVRENPAKRTARVTIGTVDLAANYTVGINGTSVTVNGPFVDVAEIIDDLVAALTANGTINALVSSAATGTPHDTVLITGRSETDYYVTMSATGTGVVAVVADPASCSARVWALSRGTNETETWRLHPNVLGTSSWAITTKNLDLGEFAVGRVDRLYVELHTIAGVASDGGAVTYAITAQVGYTPTP